MSVYIGILSLIICTFSGYRLSCKYIERRKFFSDFYSFNEKMINEVSFTQKSLLNLSEKEKEAGSDFGNVLYGKIAEQKDISLKYLKEEETVFFNEYVKNIGKSNRESQLVFLTAEKKMIDELRVEAQNDEKKYGKLFVKLGFLFGLIIFVALI